MLYRLIYAAYHSLLAMNRLMATLALNGRVLMLAMSAALISVVYEGIAW